MKNENPLFPVYSVVEVRLASSISHSISWIVEDCSSVSAQSFRINLWTYDSPMGWMCQAACVDKSNGMDTI